MPEIIIFDYGVGNLFSLKNALETVGLTVKISQSLKESNSIDGLALPGVGSFPAALERIEPVREVIRNLVGNGIPILGICLGMQLFFEKSDEGQGQGLSFFKGKNIRLPSLVKIPHMGWNTINIVKQNEILKNIKNNSYVYFVHSLYPLPIEPEIILTKTEYGELFTSMVSFKNIFGTQFHPEKSGEIGLEILRNFANIVKR
jgi:glutamine amidotransferase